MMDPENFRCSWCGGPLEDLYQPEHASEFIVGWCAGDDGIVTVERKPPKAD